MPHPDPASATTDVVVLRPYRIRVVCWVLAPLVVVAFSLLGAGLSGPTGSGQGVFSASDRVAMTGLGLLAAAAILLFTRPKVTADARQVTIRNVIGGYQLPWQVVRALRFDGTSPWLTLELHDDEVVAVMAVQAADKDRAVAGVRALRHLHAAATAPPLPPSPPPPPPSG